MRPHLILTEPNLPMKKRKLNYTPDSSVSFQTKYELQQVLGRGRNGLVYQVQEKMTKNVYAAKIIKQTGSHQRNFQIVQNEFRVFEAIKNNVGYHLNINHLHEVIHDKDASYFILELLEGGELFDRVVEKVTYSEMDASALIKKMVQGLQALHGANIIHRDMKPENVVFATKSDCSELKVIDFGHSLLRNSEVTLLQNDLVGTPNYMAPEVIESRNYTPACDIWSIGVILYILLSGYAPFTASTTDRVFQLICNSSLTFHDKYWCDISPEGKDLVKRMLDTDPTNRISCSEILSHPWIIRSTKSNHLPETIRRLEKFNGKRKLKAAAMACIWGARFGRRKKLSSHLKGKNFSSNELLRMRYLFEKESVNGVVTKDQFKVIMKDLGLGDYALDRMFQLFDKDENNQINYKELLMGIGTLRGGEDDDSTLKFCFGLIDVDSSGFLSMDELSGIFRHMAVENEQESDFNKAERLLKLFEELDSNGDKLISFEEFRQGIRSNPELMKAFTLPAKRMFSSSSDSECELKHSNSTKKRPSLPAISCTNDLACKLPDKSTKTCPMATDHISPVTKMI